MAFRYLNLRRPPSRLKTFPLHQGASVAEWLERAVTVREVSGSIPGRGGHKTHCRRRVYVNIRRAVERQRFHNLIHTIQSQEQHNNIPFKRLARWNSISVRSHQMSLAHFHPNTL